MRIPFNLKFRPQIESGEYKVETKAGCPVRIVCWDMACELPILGLVLLNDEKVEEVAVGFTNEGINLLGEPLYDKLFIVTPEPELTEFEKAVGLEIFDEPFDETHIKVIKEESAKLLNLARKEIEEELKEKVLLDYWKQASDRCIQARKEGKLEALKEIEQDPESSYAFKRGFEYGKEEALKNLPRWYANVYYSDEELGIDWRRGGGFICYRGKIISLRDFMKLPGFKEDEK